MNKKILLIGYTNMNLGDDLFLTLVINRYNAYKIDLYCEKNFEVPFKNAKNVNIINKFFFNLDELNLDNYFLCIYIGGSIFQETNTYKDTYKKKEFLYNVVKKCKDEKIGFFFLSSNFGPYITEKFFNLIDKTIKLCTGINFRDKSSYNLFKKYSQVNFIPDIVYSMDFSKKKTIKNTVGISIINLYGTKRGNIDKNYFEYMKFLKKNIEKYISENKTIYLYSFCSSEGDDKAINTLISMINSRYWKKIKVIKYVGNLEEFLNIYSRMEYMLCTRFHSMILSSIFGEKLVVVNYSTKISNVIKDYKLGCEYIEINKDIENKLIPLEKYKICNNVDNIRKLAKNHYKEIDKYIIDNSFEKINNDFTLKGYYPVKKNIFKKWLNSKKKLLKKFIKKSLVLLKIMKEKESKKVVAQEVIDFKEKNKHLLNSLLENNKIDENTYNNCIRKLGYEATSSNLDEINSGPLVSIIIPTYKRDNFLFDCIDSLISQSYKNIEIIVVDDYVESNLEATFKKKYGKYNNIIYTKNKVNSYAGISRMNGYRLAKGEYIVFCDEDDFFIDDRFVEKSVNSFLDNKDINLVGFNSFDYFFDINRITFKNISFDYKVNCLDYINAFQIEYFKPAPSFAMFKKAVLDENDFYNLKMMNDSTIFLNAMKKGKLIFYNNPVGFYRKHSVNINNSLSYQFIIDNLIEKKKIYEYLKENSYVENPDYWWYQQLKLTVNYYLKGNKRSNKDFKELMDWCLNNMTKYKKELLKEMKDVQKGQLKK